MLQRLVTAAALICTGIAHLHTSSTPGFVVPQIMEVVTGTFLLVGLWTPLIGVIVACREMWLVFFGSGDPWLRLVLAALGASLSLIGPGSWSIDARLFGRKHIKPSSRYSSHPSIG